MLMSSRGVRLNLEEFCLSKIRDEEEFLLEFLLRTFRKAEKGLSRKGMCSGWSAPAKAFPHKLKVEMAICVMYNDPC